MLMSKLFCAVAFVVVDPCFFLSVLRRDVFIGVKSFVIAGLYVEE